MTPYPTYKDSGLAWLGSIPTHWDVLRADGMARQMRQAVDPKAMETGTVFHYSIPVIESTGDGQIEETSRIDSNKLLLQGDELLVSRLNPRKARILLAQPHAMPTICSTEFVALQVFGCDKHYAEYLYSSEGVRQYLSARVESATKSHQRVSPEHIAKLWLALPPPAEQTAIVAFLDRKGEEIDRFLHAKRRLIALLREQKAILITLAVTQGLNPDAPTKPSGGGWLGDVPAHWDVRRLKLVASISSAKLDAKPADLPYLGLENIEARTGKLLMDAPTEHVESAVNVFQAGDVLFGKLRPYLAKVVRAPFDGVCTTELLVVQPGPQMGGKFLSNLMLSDRFISEVNAQTYGAKMPRANAEQIGNMVVAMPPPDEQAAIVAHIDRESEKIDRAIARTEREMELTHEYRAALIAEAVTGKIDVRPAAQSAPHTASILTR